MKICGQDIPSAATVIGMWGTTHDSGVDVLLVAVRWDATTHRIIQRFEYPGAGTEKGTGDKSVTVFEHKEKTDAFVCEAVSTILSRLFDLGYERGCRMPHGPFFDEAVQP